MGTTNSYPAWSKRWIIADKTAVEAGYVNDKDDAGGETNCGITKAVAMRYLAELKANFGWNGQMRDLTKEMAFYIYDVGFWRPLRLDDIHARCPQLADKMFDIGINIGPGVAAKWLQTTLNVLNLKQKHYPDLLVDGALGAKTIAAIDACMKARGKKETLWTILKALLCKQGAHYIDISVNREDNETFTFGWYNRLDHNLKEYYGALKV